MSTRADFLHQAPSGQPARIFDLGGVERERRVREGQVGWNPQHYGEEQILGLVRQVFFPGWPKPARQVVFCPVEEGGLSEICMRIGQALACQIPGSVCVVETDQDAEKEETLRKENGSVRLDQTDFSPLRNWSQQLSSKLWRMPLNISAGENGNGRSVETLAGILRELRLEFDYTVLQGPSAGVSSEAVLLGHLSDGVILVLEANSTRRLVAQKVKQMLQEANVRLLGTVLNNRRFPIPAKIYRKL